MTFSARLAKRFKQKRLQFAHVLVNEQLTPLTVEYGSKKIIIGNLGEDFPPLIRISRTTRNVEASVDRDKWLSLEESEERELQIYLVLDPAFLLSRIVSEEITESGHTVMVDGWYRIDKLQFPEVLVRYFRKADNLRRWVRLFAIGDHLLSMSQQDFPPYKDMVTLIFGGRSPYPIFPFISRP